MFRTSRLAATLVAGSLALGLAVGPAPSSSAVPARADRAGDWLVGQLDHGLVHNEQYDFDDYGLTTDVGITLAAMGGHRKALRQVRRALERNVDNYTRGGGTDVYAGSTAKLAVFADIAGAKPRSFGTVNLVRRLAARVSTEKRLRGRIQDASAYGDYANVIGQAYAVGALGAAGSGKAKPVTRFLLKQQCSPGYFRTYFADPTDRDQTCDGAKRADRAPDTDATALALLNLMSLPRQGKAVRKAIARGVRWLHRHQKGDGSFSGGPTTTTPNANSTGLSAWVLASAGRCGDAQQAARWVRKLQRKNGAIAYEPAVKRQPIDESSQDQWRRATAQAAPSLVFLRGC